MPVVAYNPKLYLIESHVASYKIYTLTNPIINQVFYVGQTMQDLATRLAGHISETGANREKINYIKEIIDSGYKPIIQEIETIHTTCYIDKAAVCERENYWIKYYKGIGCKLLNIATPQGYEYKNYLSSIKRGETSWHYYYCGKTVSGVEVYDEQRMIADGFSLDRQKSNVEYQYSQAIPSHYYNPWENERFLKMVGYESYCDMLYCSGSKLNYDKAAYKDLDPNYYEQDDCVLFL